MAPARVTRRQLRSLGVKSLPALSSTIGGRDSRRTRLPRAETDPCPGPDFTMIQCPPAPAIILTLYLPGQPVGKGRPRHNGANTYTPAKTRRAEADLAALFRAARTGPPVGCRVGVYAVFGQAGRRPADVDNYLKMVLDAANKVVWADDSQVTETHAYKIVGVEEPYTQITVYRAPG